MTDFHPVANIFPLLEGDEFEALKADIAKHGQLERIWTYRGKILDGRNRYRACNELGLTPKCKDWGGDDPLSFVVSLNLFRRHLNSSQRAVAALDAEKMLAVEAKERQRAAGGDPKTVTQRIAEAETGEAREQAAKLFCTNRQYVSDAKKIESESPELLNKIRVGEITIPQAKAQTKKQERIEQIEQQVTELAIATPVAPVGLFHVINIDPPWPYDTPYDPLGNRGSCPYPEISLVHLADINIPAAADCVLWLWTTHRFLRHSFGLLDGWGFRDVAIITWVKDRMGLGRWLRSQSEYCIMSVQGKPPINLTNQTTVLHGPMREHSRKPDEFYALVDSLCVGRKLDYFSREQRPGWAQFGDEVRKFA